MSDSHVGEGRFLSHRSCASRRAAPGDTLREDPQRVRRSSRQPTIEVASQELMVMRLGADADRGAALDHTLRGR